jgi:hypothetical protein
LELLTTAYDVVIISNMKAQLMIKTRRILSEISFAEVVVWKLPAPIKGSKHSFKYRLAFLVEGVCVLRYDNEQGKGDHKHIGEMEISYGFTTPEQLLADFWKDIDNWR